MCDAYDDCNEKPVYDYNGVKTCHGCLMDHFGSEPDEREYFMETSSLDMIKIRG